MGVSHKALVWASVAEAALVLAAAALVTAVFARPLFATALAELDAPNWMQVVVPVAAAVVFIAVSVTLVRSHAEHQGIIPLLKGSAAACLLYALFFLANGILLAWLVMMLPTTAPLQQPPWELAGIVALAWFAGFIVPGAPAGIGIREFVLTLGLEHAGLAGSAVSLAIAYRSHHAPGGSPPCAGIHGLLAKGNSATRLKRPRALRTALFLETLEDL